MHITIKSSATSALSRLGGLFNRYEPMIKILLSLTLTLLASSSVACVIEPASHIASDPEKFIEVSDVVFFGKLVEFEDFRQTQQIVKFSVEKAIKGAPPDAVTVVNKIHTSCSRLFQVKGSKYYVFASKTDDKKILLIDGYGTFVPESVALEKGANFEEAHNNSIQPTGYFPRFSGYLLITQEVWSAEIFTTKKDMEL